MQLRVAPGAMVAARAIDRAQVRLRIGSRSRQAGECAADMECLMPSATTTTAAPTDRLLFAFGSRLGRRVVWAAVLVAAPALMPGTAPAQATDWPAKPVTVVVGYAAGGNTDVMARMASKKLTEDLKQSFVVENRIGAGGALAAAYVAQAAPDGYTLFFAAAPQIAIVPQLQKVNYDPKKDFTPVSVFGTGPFILGISSSIPAKTIAEFVAYAKTRKINYGSSGAGSVAHLAGALFVNRAGLDAVHVPFRGSGQVTAALLGGQIDMFFGNASDLVPQAENGKVILLGVATPQRMKQLPNVPTIGETYPSTSLESWNGFLVPAKTPPEIIDKLARHIIAAAKDPATVAQLNALGIEANGTTPEEFAAQINREQPQFDDAIKAAKLQPE
jgi:tripartite-type tricarboxylate transporter receptor subunit TctC